MINLEKATTLIEGKSCILLRIDPFSEPREREYYHEFSNREDVELLIEDLQDMMEEVWPIIPGDSKYTVDSELTKISTSYQVTES